MVFSNILSRDVYAYVLNLVQVLQIPLVIDARASAIILTSQIW
jgi:hypothetical protein